MFKIHDKNLTYTSRFFTVTFTREDDETSKEISITVDVTPAKLKTLRKIENLKADKDNASFDEFAKLICKIFSKNKQKIKVDDYIDDLDIDELSLLLENYVDWLSNNPN